jgi:galactokinase
MTLADQFVARGCQPDDAERQAALVRRTSASFAAALGRAPEWRWFVPGRLEVFGKHTDYAGGDVLVAAAPRGFAVAASPRDDGRLHVVDVKNDVSLWLAATDTGSLRPGWASYLQVTRRRLATNFPGAPLGLDLAFASDLPRAAGMSSSSALVTAAATALISRGALDQRDEWRRAIRTPEDHATYLGCIENGATFGPLSGTSGVGTHGGSEDHTAILLGEAGTLGHFRFVPTTRVARVPCPPCWVFVVATSGVHADKAGSVRDRYNRATYGIRALLARWNAAAAVASPSLAAALQKPGAEAHLRELVRRDVPDGWTVAALLERLDHFLAEDAIVREAVDAVHRSDAPAVGALAARSQAGAERWLGNQVPETSLLAALARDCGAYGATSFGAGFGGGVWALVHADQAGAFADAWVAAYRHRWPAATNVAVVPVRPGPGVIALPHDAA